MKKTAVKDNPLDYNVSLHRRGRIWTAAAIIMMACVPIFTGLVVGSGPDWRALALSLVMLTAFYLPSALGEVLAYSYVLGTNGTYLAFITGNLSNLKIPCAINAANIAGTKAGTEENEIASTISIAVSSIVTSVVIAIGVLLISVTPAVSALFENPKLQPSFEVVVFALFGALGGRYIAKYPKIAIIPYLGMSALCIVLVLAGKGSAVKASYFCFVGIALCFLTARKLYYKKCIAEQQEKEKAEQAAAAGTVNAGAAQTDGAAMPPAQSGDGNQDKSE